MNVYRSSAELTIFGQRQGKSDWRSQATELFFSEILAII